MKQNHSLGYYEHFLHQIVLMNEIHFFFQSSSFALNQTIFKLVFIEMVQFYFTYFIFCPKEMTTVS